jgi:hypothetical protein
VGAAPEAQAEAGGGGREAEAGGEHVLLLAGDSTGTLSLSLLSKRTGASPALARHSVAHLHAHGEERPAVVALTAHLSVGAPPPPAAATAASKQHDEHKQQLESASADRRSADSSTGIDGPAVEGSTSTSSISSTTTTSDSSRALVLVGLANGAVVLLRMVGLELLSVYTPKQHSPLRALSLVQLRARADEPAAAAAAEAAPGDGQEASPQVAGEEGEATGAGAFCHLLVHASEHKLQLLQLLPSQQHKPVCEYEFETSVAAACVVHVGEAPVLLALTEHDELLCIGLPDCQLLLSVRIPLAPTGQLPDREQRLLALAQLEPPRPPALCWSDRDATLTAALASGEVLVLKLGGETESGSQQPSPSWSDALCSGADISLVQRDRVMPPKPPRHPSHSMHKGMQSVKGFIGWLSAAAAGAAAGAGGPSCAEAARAQPAAADPAPTSLAEVFRLRPRAPPQQASAQAASSSSARAGRDVSDRTDLFGRAAAGAVRAGPAANDAASRGGKERAIAGRVNSARSGIQEGVEALHERGAKLGNLAERVERLNMESESFFDTAKKLREQQEKNSKLFGFF